MTHGDSVNERVTQSEGGAPGRGDSVNGQCVNDVREYKRATIKRAPVHDEWLAQRAPFVGASQAAALFGDHPFITLADIAREKRGGERQPDNDAMARGRHLEEAIAQWWAVEHGVDIAESGDLFLVDDVLVATLDRVLVGQPIALEVKTTATRVWDVERYWWWQAQAQLVATGFDRIEFAVLDGTLKLKSFTVEPEPTAMANIVDAARMFLEAVDNGVDFDDVTYAAPPALELDAHMRETLRAWRFAERERERIDQDIAILKGIIDRALGPCDRATVNGHEVVRRMHRTVRNMIDAQRLRAELPDIARKYVKEPSTSHWLVLK